MLIGVSRKKNPGFSPTPYFLLLPYAGFNFAASDVNSCQFRDVEVFRKKIGSLRFVPNQSVFALLHQGVSKSSHVDSSGLVRSGSWDLHCLPGTVKSSGSEWMGLKTCDKSF